MSVRAALHLDPLLQAADDTWPQWTRTEPLLTRFASHAEVAQWRMDDVDWQEDREMFLALGRLTLVEESRTAATAVLVFLVLPACEATVMRRASMTHDVRQLEDVAAGYLWTEVAQYPWDDPMKGWIPQGVARRVGRAIDRDFGWGETAERIWRDRATLDFEAVERLNHRGAYMRPLHTTDLYWWAVTEAGLSREDMDLLVALAVTAHEDGITSRSSAGITARSACVQLVQPGQTVDQLQYRARKALTVLREAARSPAA